MPTVRDVYGYLDKFAPFKNQEKDDNGGLLVGDMDAIVRKIIVCLDVTYSVVQEAAEKNANLIVSHHPLMYRGIKKLPKSDPVHSLILNDINFIAAHTSVDVADGGITDLMIARLGFSKSEAVIDAFNPDGSGFGKVVDLNKPMSAEELAEKCKKIFGCSIIRYVDAGKPIKKIGLCSGGGSMLVEKAFDMGCDAYICGDLRWDRLVFGYNYGMTLIDAGHFHTEDIFCDDLRDRLKSVFPKTSVEKSQNSVDVCSYV